MAPTQITSLARLACGALPARPAGVRFVSQDGRIAFACGGVPEVLGNHDCAPLGYTLGKFEAVLERENVDGRGRPIARIATHIQSAHVTVDHRAYFHQKAARRTQTV